MENDNDNNDSNNDDNNNDNDDNNSNNHNSDRNNDNNDSNNSIIIGNTIKLIYTVPKYHFFDKNCFGSAFLSFSILNKHKKNYF